MRAWLPYADRAEAERMAGPLPDNVTIDLFEGPEHDWPGHIDEVGLFVLPYMDGGAALARVDEMAGLEAVLLQTAGYEHVADRIPDGVALCNAAGVHDAATAELAIALALASGRGLYAYARDQGEQIWEQRWGTSLADKRVLIVGYGNIGRAIEARLAGFEAASITRVANRARDGVHPVAELDTLLPEADVVFVIAPHTPETDRMFDARRLALLPDDALFVNVSRGRLADTDAIVAEAGRLRFALDVVDPEPLPADHPLWSADGVVITPHVGGTADSFPSRSGRLIGEQLRRWARGEELVNRVV